jgi:hypothetical protein
MPLLVNTIYWLVDFIADFSENLEAVTQYSDAVGSSRRPHLFGHIRLIEQEE